MAKTDNDIISIKPFGKPIEVRIKVQPEIVTRRLDNKYKQITQVRYAFECNGKAMWITDKNTYAYADHYWIGDHTGPYWKKAKNYWYEQINYLKKFLHRALTTAAFLMLIESVIAKRDSDILDIVASKSDYNKVVKLFKEHLSRRSKSKTLRGDVIEAIPTIIWLFTKNIYRRISGKEPNELNHPKKLLCSPYNFELFKQKDIEIYKKWKRAHTIYKNGGARWRQQVRDECGKLPDDLIDALQDNIDRKAFQLAIVHCAREAGFGTSDGEPLEANSWATVRREIIAYEKRTGTTILHNKRNIPNRVEVTT